MKQIEIKKEFKDLIPPLSDEELETLERSILDVGITDDIQVWHDIIIDGHNRFNIALKHDLKYNTKELKFDDENDVVEYLSKIKNKKLI